MIDLSKPQLMSLFLLNLTQVTELVCSSNYPILVNYSS